MKKIRELTLNIPVGTEFTKISALKPEKPKLEFIVQTEQIFNYLETEEQRRA